MADDIRRLRHTAEDIDKAIEMLLEVYTCKEIDTKFAEASAKIASVEERLTALEKGA